MSTDLTDMDLMKVLGILYDLVRRESRLDSRQKSELHVSVCLLPVASRRHADIEIMLPHYLVGSLAARVLPLTHCGISSGLRARGKFNPSLKI